MSSDAQLSANSSLGVYAVDTDYLSVEQSLGTEFGQSTQFTTITVNFQRGDMLCLMSVMYDDLRGLRQRGIVMERTKKGQPQSQPQAFPGNVGCEPPKNWRG